MLAISSKRHTGCASSGLAACLPDSASLTPRYPYTDKDLDEIIAAPERFLDAVEFEKETIQ
jgi:hypothetical protein